ncbi:MAG: PKD-like domain-containing protein [Pedobacter sp.]
MNKQHTISIVVMLAIAILLVGACKKEIQQAPTITGVSGELNTLNIGDRLVLAPNITNTRGNSYSWLINGKEVATGQINYTFEAKEAGDFEVTFRIDNKGGSDQKTFKITVEKAISIVIPEMQPFALSQVTEIKPTITGPDRNDYEYQWAIGDQVIGTGKNLNFISPESGNFTLTLKVSAGKQSVSATKNIQVSTATYIANAYTVLEFVPAPGKLHNWSVIGDKANWQYFTEFPLPYSDFLAKASEMRKTNLYASLFVGAWGGQATFKFDHTVANVAGKTDLELMAYCSIKDLPAVYVAYDRNKNGKPDADEWYELKNADYGLEDLPDYQMTFTHNRTETDATRVYTYVDWADNQVPPLQGQHVNNKTFNSGKTSEGKPSTRGFFPGYYMDYTTKIGGFLAGWSTGPIVLKGKRVTKDVTGAAPFFQKFNLDIDNAVTAKGVPVVLPGVDFVKVQKVVYPMAKLAATGDVLQDQNMEEGRMLQVASIVDKNLKN